MPESVHSQDRDQSMVDAEQPAHEQEVVSNDPILEERQIVVVRINTTPLPRPATTNRRLQLPGATDTAASFQFAEEGHTMGNALRFAIMKK
jgi:DNA-directed RNA polymerase I and III subunit RPAC2